MDLYVNSALYQQTTTIIYNKQKHKCSLQRHNIKRHITCVSDLFNGVLSIHVPNSEIIVCVSTVAFRQSVKLSSSSKQTHIK